MDLTSFSAYIHLFFEETILTPPAVWAEYFWQKSGEWMHADVSDLSMRKISCWCHTAESTGALQCVLRSGIGWFRLDFSYWGSHCPLWVFCHSLWPFWFLKESQQYFERECVASADSFSSVDILMISILPIHEQGMSSTFPSDNFIKVQSFSS